MIVFDCFHYLVLPVLSAVINCDRNDLAGKSLSHQLQTNRCHSSITMRVNSKLTQDSRISHCALI